MDNTHYKVLIAGSGIAGLSAAVYTSRGGNETVLFRGNEPGGQLTLTTEVANYPGFPDPISGPDLVGRMEDQATKFGTEIKDGLVENVNDSSRPFEVQISTGETYTADSIIVASGASARKLGVPGEDRLLGYGVSTCATCDGAFFRGEDMVVVGGGDAAFEDAVFLTKFADKVHILHRREGLRAKQYLQDQVQEEIDEGKIEMTLNTEVTSINGTQGGGIEDVELVTNPEGYPSKKMDHPETEEWSMDTGAVFLAIGHTPNTGFLKDTGVQLDETGYIQIDGELGSGQTETDVEGIFGAGDVFDFHYQQAATAAGSGVKASMDANDYLENL